MLDDYVLRMILEELSSSRVEAIERWEKATESHRASSAAKYHDARAKHLANLIIKVLDERQRLEEGK